MKYRKGAATVWVIVLLIIIVIAGAAFWFSTRSSAQPTTASATESQAQQTTSQPAQATQTQTPEQYAILPLQPVAEIDPRTNNASLSSENPPSLSPQAVTVRNQNGQMTATPDASGSWQFTFTGAFAQLQQSYVLDWGDGTQTTLQCETPSADGQSVCDQFAPVSHTYAEPGAYQAQLIETSAGASNEQDSTLLSVTVPDSSTPSAPASDNTPPPATPSGSGSSGSNSNSGPITNSGNGGSHIQAGCTFMTAEGGCITLNQ
jgi:hypothetical protein